MRASAGSVENSIKKRVTTRQETDSKVHGLLPCFQVLLLSHILQKNYDGKYLKLVNPMKDRFIFLIFVCRLK